MHRSRPWLLGFFHFAFATLSGLTFCSATKPAPATPTAPATAPSSSGTAAATAAMSPAIVALPGKPFQALPSRDGRFVFVSLAEGESEPRGIAVLSLSGNSTKLLRVVPLEDAPTGMTITHDGAMLVVAASETIAFLDVAKLESANADPLLGAMREIAAGRLGRIYCNVTADDRTLFVSDERARTITVVDLPKARATNFAASTILGKIPVGGSPVDLAFSKDERFLFTTSQIAARDLGWPIVCGRDGAKPGDAPEHGEGAIYVVDVARARTDPANSIADVAPAGCNPVRLVVSPDGARAYVSARGSNALLAFDTEKLTSDPMHARIAEVPVGTAPVGVAVYDEGKRVLVTSSNRFHGGADDRQRVYAIDATRIEEGAASILGTISAGAFPREMRVTSDGATLLLTNYASSSLELVDLRHPPIEARIP